MEVAAFCEIVHNATLIVDDIEDILKSEDNDGELDEVDRLTLPNKSFVVPKNLKKFQKSKVIGEEDEEINTDSTIPGQGKIYVKTCVIYFK